MLLVEIRRISVSVFVVLCCVPTLSAETIAGLHGGSYEVGTTGDRITSLTNDDGSVIHYQYDGSGVETGMTVSMRSGVSLSLQYFVGPDGSGWLQAGSLPMLMSMNDPAGRTGSVLLYPGMTVVNGEWYVDASAGDPILAATFRYGPGGHLSGVTLDSGLSLQLGIPTDSVVSQSLIRPDGTVALTASAIGDTPGVNVVPAQLDAIATRFGLGADWAESMTFTMAASGHVTTGWDLTGAARLYLVDAGPFRVGFAPDGTALFYDFMPAYTNGEMIGDPAIAVAAVVPSHIVMTADGAAGLYTDRPAYGAVYTAWTETNASGITDARFATIEPAPSSSRSVATDSGFRGRFRVKSERFMRYRTVVCVDSVCWERGWIEWLDDPDGYSGGGSPSGVSVSGPPATGGRPPFKPGNQFLGDMKIQTKIDRGLNKAKTKLQNQTCKALLERIGVDNKKLADVMTARGYNDPGKYLTNHLSYIAGNSKQCAGDPVASTDVGTRIVAICRAFGNVTDGMASVYLIHEMMHTLGYGESPQIPGFPTSPQITEDVGAACGRN